MKDTVTKTDLVFRGAGAGDAAFAADVDTAVRPRSPRDPEVYEYTLTAAGKDLDVALARLPDPTRIRPVRSRCE